LTQVNAPELPIRHAVERHLPLGPPPEVVTFTTRVIVPPGPTVTDDPPLRVMESTLRASVKLAVTDTPDVNPVAV